MKFKDMDICKVMLNEEGKIGVDFTDKGKEYLKYYNVSPDFFMPILSRLIMAMADKDQGEDYTNRFYNCFMAIFCCYGKVEGEYDFAFMDGSGTVDMLMQQKFGQKYIDIKMDYLNEIGETLKDFEGDIKPMWDELADDQTIKKIRNTQSLDELKKIRKDIKKKNDQSGGEYESVLAAVDEQIKKQKTDE